MKPYIQFYHRQPNIYEEREFTLECGKSSYLQR